MPDIVDYTACFPDAIAAHGKGQNVLILSKLEQPSRRFDGKKATYEVQYRSLSAPCGNPHDQAWACVQHSERSFWLPKEFDLKGIKAGSKTLFNEFQLF